MAVCEKCEETHDPGIMGSTAYCDHCDPGPPTTCPICGAKWLACHHHEDHVIAHLSEKVADLRSALVAAQSRLQMLAAIKGPVMVSAETEEALASIAEALR